MYIWAKRRNVTQLCLTLCDPMNYTVHGILQATILEWVAVPFSRGSSPPRGWTQVSHISGQFFTSWATREVHIWANMIHLSTSIVWRGEGNGNPLQYSCLENPLDRGAWWAAVRRVPPSRTQLKQLSSSSSSSSRTPFGLPWCLSSKESTRQCRRKRFDSWVRKIP